MQINHVIHAPSGKRILAQKITGTGVCLGVMADDMYEGAYPPLHRISFPESSIIEDITREIRIRGEQLQRLAGAQSSAN
jgi:hypothetical protein